MKSISFVINCSKNTLEYLKLLVQSLKVNLYSKDHQILIFIDSDNEGILEYLLSEKNNFNDFTIINNTLKPCVGYSRNNNLLVDYAKHYIVSYLQSHMVISPNYDLDILSQLQEDTILSSTRVEPPLHGISDKTITKNFGLIPKDFSLDTWNRESILLKKSKTASYFFAPITFYKDVWLSLGGYDTVFRRSREDSDLVQRALHSGISLVQTYQAIVYHFSCVSSRGVDWFNKSNSQAASRVDLQNKADYIELRRFLRKWGDFNHGENKLYKLDIDLELENLQEADLNLIYNIEPFFSRVWIPSESIKLELSKLYNKEHLPANILLEFTEDMWNNNKRYYNLESIEDKVKVGKCNSYNIKFTMDFRKLKELPDSFKINCTKLYDILINLEKGKYDFDGILVDINSKNIINPSLKIENPPFDTEHLQIFY